MSHTFAARCVVCGGVDDPICPECGTPSSDTHGTTDQRPFRGDLIYSDGSRHEWHADCITPTTDQGRAPESRTDD